jgi:signal transduction histidine kinase
MILKNLVGNAAKFTTAGRIVVTLAVDGEALVITVADTGIGIPSEQLATLFEAFQQAHGEHSRQAGGVGLGLFIVHRLARSMDGTIDIRSTEGEGTTVTVRLPGQVLSERS